MSDPSSRDVVTPRDLMRLRPVPPGGHRAAFRAGLSVAIPLLTLIALDLTQWTVYAAFGAFTALYGRNQVHLSRAAMQASAGLSLTVAVGLAAVTAAASPGAGTAAWTLVICSVLVAAAGASVSTVFDWHPAGPVFVLFAFGTVASTDAGWADVPIAWGVCAASAVLAILIGNVGAVVRRTPGTPRPALRAPSAPEIAAYVGVVGASGAIATLAGIGHPWWAMVAAAAPLTVRGPDNQMLRAWQRIVGTGLGLLTATPLLLLDLAPVPLVLVVTVLQVITELVIGRNYAWGLLFITPMALLMGQLGSSLSPARLLLDRGLETVIGGLVAATFLAILLRTRSNDDLTTAG